MKFHAKARTTRGSESRFIAQFFDDGAGEVFLDFPVTRHRDAQASLAEDVVRSVRSDQDESRGPQLPDEVKPLHEA